MTNRRLLYLLPIFALPLTASAQTAQTGDTAPMKCGANQDRVWVYDSLTDLNVEAKLKCNEAVQIVSRVKGYVKIQSANGTEGYVPDSVFPDLPPLPPSPDDSVAGSALAMAASHAAAMKNSAAKSETVAVAPAPTTAPERVVPAVASAATPSGTASVAANVVPSPAPGPTVSPVDTTVAAPDKPAITPSLTQPVAKRATATKPPEAPVVASVEAAPAIAAAPAASVAPPPAPIAAPVVSARVSMASAGSAPAPTPALEASTAAPVVTTQPAQIAPPPAPPAKKVKRDATTSTRVATNAPTPVAPPAPAMAPAPMLTEAKMDVNPAVVLQQPKMKAALVESEDYPDAEPENESADPACHIYFSAYGLSPSQFKWLAANRKKEYPSVCPAPNVASVDFVILFTHDSDTYTGAMPEPVHTDHSGFSDFNPLTTVDSALLSGADADKAHREYVWVFLMKRGAFDPAKFSPRRRPQFTTMESKGSARALEDAFGYVQEQGATQIAANQ